MLDLWGGLGACGGRGEVGGPADLMDGGALEGDAPAQQLRLPAAEGLMAGGGNQILGHELQPHPASHPRLRGCPTPKELYGAALQSTSAPHRLQTKVRFRSAAGRTAGASGRQGTARGVARHARARGGGGRGTGGGSAVDRAGSGRGSRGESGRGAAAAGGRGLTAPRPGRPALGKLRNRDLGRPRGAPSPLHPHIHACPHSYSHTRIHTHTHSDGRQVCVDNAHVWAIHTCL